MTARWRIRSHVWTAGDSARTPWRWVPLTLQFRKRRLAARPAAVRAEAVSASPQSVSYFTRHLHYHAHEGARILSRTDRRETILREPSYEARSSSQEVAGPDPAGPMALRHARERSMETRLSARATRDLEQVHTRIHRIERIALESEVARWGRITTSIVDTILLPARKGFRAHREWPSDTGRALEAGRSIEPTAEIRLAPAQSKIVLETAARGRTTEPERVADRRTFPAAPLPVEQVWRTQQAARESARETVSTLSPAPSKAPASNPKLAALQPQASYQAPSPPAWRKPDELEMDRLADNVMKRIERHVRIERERRGR